MQMFSTISRYIFWAGMFVVHIAVWKYIRVFFKYLVLSDKHQKESKNLIVWKHLYTFDFVFCDQRVSETQSWAALLCVLG